jgi:uncharacterized protein YndB with AHSA1/START domain
MLKILLLGVAALIVILALVIAMRSPDFAVERSMEMNAPAATVFRYVNDPHQVEKWNPWMRLDPNVKSEISGASSGVGSVYTWEGSSQVGKGRQTIVESVPDKKVAIKLEFFKPMQATNDVVFALDENGGRTNLTWRMTGKQNFMMKGMSMFMNMDRMIGDEFTKGLTTLKTLAEADTQPADRSS